MSYVVTPSFPTNKGTGGTVSTIAPMPGAKAISYIRRAGATWQTERVVIGDGALVASSGAGNNGTYLIVGIPDQETIIVRGTLAAETGVATCQPRHGLHKLTLTDEATTDWATIFATVAETGYIDRIQPRGSTVAAPVYAYYHSFSAISLEATSSGTTTTWTSKREIVYCRIQDAIDWSVVNTITNTVVTDLNLGELINGSDPLSFANGSVWFGYASLGVGGFKHMNAYGSVLWNTGTTTRIITGDGDELYGCLLIGQCSDIDTGTQTTGVKWRNVAMYGTAVQRPPFILDSIDVAENIVMGRTGAQSALIFGTTVLRGLAITGSTFTPPWLCVFQDIDFRDLQTDKDLTTLVTIGSPGSTSRKSYTFNRIFKGPNGAIIVGALVSIWKSNDLTPLTEVPISGSPFTTDASGRINGGVGVPLETQVYRDNGFPTTIVENFSHRILIEAPGMRIENVKFKIIRDLSGTFSLQIYEAALEGEEPTL